VLERNVRPGDLSTAGASPMFRIASGGQIEVAAEVPEAYLGQIRVGQPVGVTLPDGGEVTGKVRLVSPQVDQQTKLGVARVSLPSGRNLRPGGFARARFTEIDRPAVVVPDKAVIFDADGAYVMVVNSANQVHRTPVKTGGRSQGFIELIQGPPAGARVLMTGSTFVLEGDTVRPTPAGAPGSRP
jgi:HlyD family secretion protein